MMEPENPYLPPQVVHGSSHDFSQINIKDLKKIEAIIKDAGQFWIALIFCLFCTMVGMLLIMPWYVIRLLQWNFLSNTYPKLLERNVPHGSLPQRFQSSRWKLIAGLVGGAMLTMAILGLIVLSWLATLDSSYRP